MSLESLPYFNRVSECSVEARQMAVVDIQAWFACSSAFARFLFKCLVTNTASSSQCLEPVKQRNFRRLKPSTKQKRSPGVVDYLGLNSFKSFQEIC